MIKKNVLFLLLLPELFSRLKYVCSVSVGEFKFYFTSFFTSSSYYIKCSEMWKGTLECCFCAPFFSSQLSGLHASRCVVIPLAKDEILQRRRQTCWEHLLGSLPPLLSLLPSLHLSLAASLLNLSLPFLSSVSISPPFHPSPPSLHPCVPASPICPLTGATGVKLSKHSLWCWSTLHTVMYLLCNTQDEGRRILLGCHVLSEDTEFTVFIFYRK